MSIQEPVYQSPLEFLDALAKNFERATKGAKGEEITPVFHRSIARPEEAFQGKKTLMAKAREKLSQPKSGEETFTVGDKTIRVTKGDPQSNLQGIQELFAVVLQTELKNPSSDPQKLQRVISFVFRCEQLMGGVTKVGFEDFLRRSLETSESAVSPHERAKVDSAHAAVVRCVTTLANEGRADLQKMTRLFVVVQEGFKADQRQQMVHAVCTTFEQHVKKAKDCKEFVSVVRGGIEAMRRAGFTKEEIGPAAAAALTVMREKRFDAKEIDITDLLALNTHTSAYLDGPQKREIATVTAGVVCTRMSSFQETKKIFSEWEEYIGLMPTGDKSIPFRAADFLPIVEQLATLWQRTGQKTSSFADSQRQLWQSFVKACPENMKREIEGALELVLSMVMAGTMSKEELRAKLGAPPAEAKKPEAVVDQREQKVKEGRAAFESNVAKADSFTALVTVVREGIETMLRAAFTKDEIQAALTIATAKMKEFRADGVDIGELLAMNDHACSYLDQAQRREVAQYTAGVVCARMSSLQKPEEIFHTWMTLMKKMPTGEKSIVFLAPDFGPIVKQLGTLWQGMSPKEATESFAAEQRKLMTALADACPPDMRLRLLGMLELTLGMAMAGRKSVETMRVLLGEIPPATPQLQGLIDAFRTALEQAVAPPMAEEFPLREAAKKVLEAVGEFIKALKEIPEPISEGPSRVPSAELQEAVSEEPVAVEQKKVAEEKPETALPVENGQIQVGETAHTVTVVPPAAMESPVERQSMIASLTNSVALGSLSATVFQYGAPVVLASLASGGAVPTAALISAATSLGIRAASPLLAPIGQYIDHQCEKLPGSVQQVAKYGWRMAATSLTVYGAYSAYTSIAGRLFAAAPAPLPIAGEAPAAPMMAETTAEAVAPAAEVAAPIAETVAPVVMEGAAPVVEAVAEKAVASAVTSVAAQVETAVPVAEGWWGLAGRVGAAFMRGARGQRAPL